MKAPRVYSNQNLIRDFSFAFFDEQALFLKKVRELREVERAVLFNKKSGYDLRRKGLASALQDLRNSPISGIPRSVFQK